MKNLALNKKILALGAESSGNFSFFQDGKIYNSPAFGDLLILENYKIYKKTIFQAIKTNHLQPNIIITDLHPEFNSTKLGAELAKKFNAKHIKTQHHIAHIFSSFNTLQNIPDEFIGVACDGTGLGLDEKIWGGEFFHFKKENDKFVFSRFAHLENHKLIGGEKSIEEPARMLISTLLNFLQPDEIYPYIKKYYTQKDFDLIIKMHRQNFNCIETSSAGRILDAASLLLGFCQNERNYKHEPIDKLEKNSTKLATLTIAPKIKKENNKLILKTAPLFQYLINNLNKNKKKLACKSQLYLAQGIEEIIKIYNKSLPVYFAGGMAKNKIISKYLKKKNVIINNNIDSGDGGISHGQLMYCLVNNEKDGD